MFSRILTSPSKTFAILLAMFCFGVAVGPLFLSVSTMLFLAVLSIGMLVGIFLPTKEQRLTTFFLFALILGVFRYSQSEIPKNIITVRDHAGEIVRIAGDVNAEPSISGASQQVTIGAVHIADQPAFGNLLVSIPKDQTIAYGDHLVFSCAIQIPRPFSGFAYDKYLQAKGTLALCRFPKSLDRTPSKSFSVVGSILAFKHDIVDKMKQVFPEPHASFLFGLVFGGNVGLDKDVQNDFAKTGTSHILAASGFNVSLFTFVFFGFIIQYLGKKRGSIATGFLLVAYVIMAGATAAVVRAAVFGAVMLIGSVIGRRAYLLNVLLFTASLMLCWNPRWLLDDVGFQLSFVAFVAIIYVAPKLEEHLLFVPERFGIRDALAGSVSAIVLTLPIMLWQFGAVSIVAPFANVFVLPLVPFLMLYTIAILPFAWLSISVAKIVALPSLWGSQYMLGIISVFASPSFASVSVPFARVSAIVTAILLIAASIAYSKK